MKSMQYMLAGALVSSLVAGLLAAVLRHLGYDLYSASAWVVLPVGALAFGSVAASGVALVAYIRNIPVRPPLFLFALATAGLALAAYHALGYRLDGATGSAWAYVGDSITRGHLVAIRGSRDLGALGGAGYVFALIRFAGLVMGGIVLLALLRLHPRCESCEAYLRRFARRSRRFRNADEFAEYRRTSETTRDFSMMQLKSTAPILRPGKGNVLVTSALYCCGACQGQRVIETVKLFDGRTWREQLGRRVEIPRGMDVRRYFRLR